MVLNGCNYHSSGPESKNSCRFAFRRAKNKRKHIIRKARHQPELTRCRKSSTTPFKTRKQRPCVNSSSFSQVGHTASQRCEFGANQWLRAKHTPGQSQQKGREIRREKKLELFAKSCETKSSRAKYVFFGTVEIVRLCEAEPVC